MNRLRLEFAIVQRMPDPDIVESVDAQLKNLRSSISDLGYQVDSYKTTTAAALGGGVFLLLLAAGATYDLVTRTGGIWLMLGVTREAFIWITIALGCTALLLLAFGLRRVRETDFALRARLEQMELEYAELLEIGGASGDSES